ncbi:MAG: hydantoinase/oxoprolinase family protein [Betaproteobacteria bacterium]|nr:hydantoinase/oxoprolinase family protein [Betaproteobacteria bacterium]
MKEKYRIGVDIGGTFTDFVMIDVETSRLLKEKLLTTPKDPSIAVLDGIGRMLRAHGVSPREVIHVIHGTTLVANAIIERKGVKTALVTTRGFRDVLEIGLEWRYDTYDLAMVLPQPLVPRALRFEATERIGPDGKVIKPLDENSLDAVVTELRRSQVSAVGISLLNGFLNPAHEARIQKLLAARLPNIVICTSSDVVPEIGEYERCSTTVANAYVLPLFDNYLRGLRGGLDRVGIRKDLYLMLSDGGTVHESTAIRHPIRLVQSGPAGGVQAATIYGQDAGADYVFCFDMGGTTAKACLIDEGEPARATEFEVARVARMKKGSGIPLRIPVIDMIEIGAGGGSIARLDRLGLIQVGPDSAGADPGPACYGLGGEFLTVTDADLVLGYLDARSFLGGDMQLDAGAARSAIERHIGGPLGISIQEAAWGIHDTVNENMARAASIHALEKAKRISDYAMVPIGGAGPVHACHIAMKLGLSRVVVPVGAGVASAFGFLAAPTAFSFVRGRVEPLDTLSSRAVTRLLAELESEGRGLLAVAGTAARVAISIQAAMRYAGQGYEVDVGLDRAWIEASDKVRIRAAFEAEYQRLFGRTEPAMQVEIVSWRLTASGPRPKLDLKLANAGFSSKGGASLKGTRAVYDAVSGSFVATAVHDRYAIAPGAAFDGPLIIEERESTVVVPRSATVRCNDSYNLIIDMPLTAT